MAVTLEDARMYIGIDVDDDAMINTNLDRALTTARMLTLSSVGENIESVLPDDPRIDQLILAYAADLYNERSSKNQKASAAQARQIEMIENQLRLEYSRRKGSA